MCVSLGYGIEHKSYMHYISRQSTFRIFSVCHLFRTYSILLLTSCFYIFLKTLVYPINAFSCCFPMMFPHICHLKNLCKFINVGLNPLFYLSSPSMMHCSIYSWYWYHSCSKVSFSKLNFIYHFGFMTANFFSSTCQSVLAVIHPHHEPQSYKDDLSSYTGGKL